MDHVYNMRRSISLKARRSGVVKLAFEKQFRSLDRKIGMRLWTL